MATPSSQTMMDKLQAVIDKTDHLELELTREKTARLKLSLQVKSLTTELEQEVDKRKNLEWKVEAMSRVFNRVHVSIQTCKNLAGKVQIFERDMANMTAALHDLKLNKPSLSSSQPPPTSVKPQTTTPVTTPTQTVTSIRPIPPPVAICPQKATSIKSLPSPSNTRPLTVTSATPLRRGPPQPSPVTVAQPPPPPFSSTPLPLSQGPQLSDTLPPLTASYSGMTERQREDFRKTCSFNVQLDTEGTGAVIPPASTTHHHPISGYSSVGQPSAFLDCSTGQYICPVRGNYELYVTGAQKGVGKLRYDVCSDLHRWRREMVGYATSLDGEWFYKNVRVACEEGEKVWVGVTREEGQAGIGLCYFYGDLVE